MSTAFAVQSTIEIIVVLLLIWGFINERKFIAFENKLFRAIGINIRNHRRRIAAEHKLLEQQTPQNKPVMLLVTVPLQPVQSVNHTKKSKGKVIAA